MRLLILLAVGGCSTGHVANGGSTGPIRFDDVDHDARGNPIQRTVLRASSSEPVRENDHVHYDGRCSVTIDTDAPVALSDDGSTIAGIAGGKLAIWDSRTCDRLETVAMTRVDGLAFIGDTRDVIVLHDAMLTKIVERGAAAPGIEQKSSSVPIGIPSSFAISPDGKSMAVGIAGRAGTLVVWDLERMVERRAIELPIVDRSVDNVAFARDGKTLVASIPVYARYRRGEHAPHAHLAVEIDTRTWRSRRKVTIPTPWTARSFVVTNDAIVWDGTAFGWDGDSSRFRVYPWHVSSGGTVAAVSTHRGYFTWQRDEALPNYSAGIIPENEFRQSGTWFVRGVARDRSMLFCTGTRCVAVRGP